MFAKTTVFGFIYNPVQIARDASVNAWITCSCASVPPRYDSDQLILFVSSFGNQRTSTVALMIVKLQLELVWQASSLIGTLYCIKFNPINSQSHVRSVCTKQQLPFVTDVLPERIMHHFQSAFELLSICLLYLTRIFFPFQVTGADHVVGNHA